MYAPDEHGNRPRIATVEAVLRAGDLAATNLANAHLIAAAPELYERGKALQVAREAHRLNATMANADKVAEASDAFDAALSQALGEGQ